jgi:NADH dehydrogenase
VAPNHDLVIRPRLYQAEPDRLRVPLDPVLDPIDVTRIAGIATAVDVERQLVSVRLNDDATTELPYARLVVAVGSRMPRPQLPGADLIHDVDTVDAAVALDLHLHALPDRPAAPGRFTAVVVGAGFTGIELATELLPRLRAIADPHGAAGDVRVVLVEREAVVGPELGAGPRPAIEATLASLGVETRLGVTLDAVQDGRVRLSDGSTLDAMTVAWTAGMRAGELTGALPAPRDRLGRLEVDRLLRVPACPDVFAGGDAAAAHDLEDHVVMQSCQHALQSGRYAGHNAAADLLGLELASFAPHGYVTCLDLGEGGALFATGWDRAVQVVGEEAKARKRHINEEYIYPPAGDAAQILAEADHDLEARTAAREAAGRR